MIDEMFQNWNLIRFNFQYKLFKPLTKVLKQPWVFFTVKRKSKTEPINRLEVLISQVLLEIFIWKRIKKRRFEQRLIKILLNLLKKSQDIELDNGFIVYVLSIHFFFATFSLSTKQEQKPLIIYSFGG